MNSQYVAMIKFCGTYVCMYCRMSLHVLIYASKLLLQNPEHSPSPLLLLQFHKTLIISVFKYGAL